MVQIPYVRPLRGRAYNALVMKERSVSGALGTCSDPRWDIPIALTGIGTAALVPPSESSPATR